jgi:hypothetical protein
MPLKVCVARNLLVCTWRFERPMKKAVFSQEKLILDNLFLDVNINIRKLLEIMQVILYGFYISVHQLTGHIIHHLG